VKKKKTQNEGDSKIVCANDITGEELE
jgi:hypothetical protein